MASAVFGLRCHSPRAVAATAFGLWLSRSSGRGCHDLGSRLSQSSDCGVTALGLWLPRSSGRDYLTTAVFGLRRHSLGLWLPQPPGCGCHDLRVVAATIFGSWLPRSSGRGCRSLRTAVSQPAGCGCHIWLWPLRDEAPTVLGLWRGIFRWAPV